MQRVTLTIPVAGHVIGDTFEVAVNADRDGLVTDSIDLSRPFVRQPYWPLLTGEVGHLDGGHLDVHIGPDLDDPADHTVTSPPLYHGWYRFSVTPRDAIGNPGGDAPAEFRVPVSSGPRAPRRFRQMGAADGRPVFGFDPPAQFRREK